MMRLTGFRRFVFLLSVFGCWVTSAQALVTVWNTAEVQPDGWRYVPALGAVYLPPETASREAVGTGTIKVRVPGQYMEFTIPKDPRWAFHRSFGWLYAPNEADAEGGFWCATSYDPQEVLTYPDNRLRPGLWLYFSSTAPFRCYVVSGADGFQGWAGWRDEERWHEARWFYFYTSARWVDLNEGFRYDSLSDLKEAAVNNDFSRFAAELERFALRPLSSEAREALTDRDRAAYRLFEAAFQPLDFATITTGKWDYPFANQRAWYFVIPESLSVRSWEGEDAIAYPDGTTGPRYVIDDFRPDVSFPGHTVLRGRPDLLDALNIGRGRNNDWEVAVLQRWMDRYVQPLRNLWSISWPAKPYTGPAISDVMLSTDLTRGWVFFTHDYWSAESEWRQIDGTWQIVDFRTTGIE